MSDNDRSGRGSFTVATCWWKYPVSKDGVVEVCSLIAQMIRQLNENEEKDPAR